MLVERFREEGTFSVTAVGPDFGRNTDVDFVLDDDMFVQAWHGKPAADRMIDRDARHRYRYFMGGRNADRLDEVQQKDQRKDGPTAKDREALCDKLRAKPYNAPHHRLHSICDEDSCFIEMTVPIVTMPSHRTRRCTAPRTFATAILSAV